MNIYLREIKAHKYSLFGWSLGMFLLVLSGMAKYGAYQGQGQSMNDLLDQFPKPFLTIFGVGGFDLSSALGYFGVLFVYIALMAAIHAILVSSDIIAKEERERTSEFLYVKPISRKSSLTSKILAILTNLIAFNLVTLISSLLIVKQYSSSENNAPVIILLMTGLFFIQLIFMSIGVAIAGISPKPKGVAEIAMSTVLAAYIISIIININPKLDWLKFLTPFKYFDPKDIIGQSHLNLSFIALSALIITVLVSLAYSSYTKRDLTV